MIYGLCGKPGGGKSYEAVVYHILPALRSGRKVITNLPLKIEALSGVFGSEKIAELVEIRTESLGIPRVKVNRDMLEGVKKGRPFSTFECYADDWRDANNKGALFVIDECHYVLGRGRTPIEISEWYSEHRHEGFDLLLLTQNFRKVDNDICDMIELVYYVSKNTMLGSSKSYTKKVKDGLRGDVVNTEQRKYEEKNFKYYQSHTKSNKAVVEANASDVKSIWSHWTVKGSAVVFLAAIFMFYKAITHTNEKEHVTAKVPKVETPVVQVAEPTPNQVTHVYKNGVLQTSSAAAPAPLPVVQPLVEAEPIKKVSAQTHPFYKVDFHIGGRYDINNMAGVLFIASQNGQDMFFMNLKDFMLAGYDATVLGDCMVELSYSDTYHDFITCDSPRVGIAVAQIN